MISLSPTEPFTPPWREQENKPPIFTLKVGDVIERSLFEAELAGRYRAGRVWAWEMLDAFTKGIETLMADDPERETLIALVQQEAASQALSDDERQMLLQARDVLAEHWPSYGLLLEQAERRRELQPLLAFRRFCVGWENMPVAFDRGRDGLVTKEAMKGLHDLDMRAAGNKVVELLYNIGNTANFPPPSKSDDDQQISPSGDRSPGDGRSKAGAGKKTPKSPSRRGSGLS